MKKLLLIALFAPIGFLSLGQQQEQYSMYMMNNFMVNPAEAGTEEFIDIKLGYRTQWVNFTGAPQTFFLSGHAPIGKKSSRFDDVKMLPFHGAGGIITGDQIGPFRINTVKAAYAYHLPVTTDLVLSLGAFGGVKQYTLDIDAVQFDPDEDQTDLVFDNSMTTMAPELSFGLWGYSSKYYFGIATFQLFPAKINIENEDGDAASDGVLDMHHWVTGGYNIQIDSNWSVIPSVVGKFVAPAPVSFDINCKVRYQDLVWAGVSYRGLDAVVAMVGVTAKKVFDIAYSYDFTTSDIRNYSNGSHELLLGLRLPNHEHAPPPAQFW